MWLLAIFCFALRLNAANVVTNWNTIASTTIVANGGKSAAASRVWFAYTSLAVYDAVNAITGEYRPFYYKGVGPGDACLETAAAAAARTPQTGQSGGCRPIPSGLVRPPVSASPSKN